MTTNFENIIYEIKDEIGTITLNRPKVLNAVNYPMMREIMQVLDSAEDDKKVRVIVLKGQGRAFSSGADFKEMDDLVERWKKDPHAYIKNIQQLEHTLLLRLKKFEKPTIAQVKGYAIGIASGIALSCDVRIVSEEAIFGPRFVRLGIMPGDGDTSMLPLLVGFGHAMEYLLTGQDIQAKDAYRMGLANRIVPIEKLDETTKEMAEKFLIAAPRAVASTKAAINSMFVPVVEAELAFSLRMQTPVSYTHLTLPTILLV